MQQQHIADSSTGDRKKHLPFPFVEQYGNNDCDKLRNTMRTAYQTDIFQTIDHKHAKNG